MTIQDITQALPIESTEYAAELLEMLLDGQVSQLSSEEKDLLIAIARFTLTILGG